MPRNAPGRRGQQVKMPEQDPKAEDVITVWPMGCQGGTHIYSRRETGTAATEPPWGIRCDCGRYHWRGWQEAVKEKQQAHES